MSSTVPRQVGLSHIRKVARCGPGNKLVSSIPPGLLLQAPALLNLLLKLPTMMG